MTLLQVILTVASVVFALFGRDLYRRQRVTFLHLIVFGGGSLLIGLFVFDSSLLDRFGAFFGVARGADALVYISIIVLLYSFISLYNKHLKEDNSLTLTISALTKTNKIILGKIEGQIEGQTQCQTRGQNLLIVMRCFNEGQVIQQSLNDLSTHGYKNIILVDDASTDDSIQKATDRQKNNTDCCLVLLQHPINRGRGGGGATLKTALMYLKTQTDFPQKELFVTFDPDGQMQAKDIQALREGRKKDTDIVLGSRFIKKKEKKGHEKGGEGKKKQTHIPFWRRGILKLSQRTSLLRDGINLSDPHCGYRLYHTKCLKYIEITSDSMDYANEIAQSIKKHKLSYTEVPVDIRYTKYSLNKGQSNLNALNIAKKLLYKKLFFR